MSASTSGSHITSEELAAYIDGRLDPTGSAKIESHMADCADCRADLVEARPLLDGAPRPSTGMQRGRSPRGPAWLAAAAIVAIAFLPLWQRVVGSHGDSPPVRATQTARATIEIVSPRPTPVDVESVVFAWRPVAGAST